MKKKPFGILRHACRMVLRNIRSYALLSVTIILSFSILLGFMGYMDSEHYNAYKQLFTKDSGLVRINGQAMPANRAALIQQRAEECGTTHSVQYLWQAMGLKSDGWTLPTGETLTSSLDTRVYSIPRECWFLEKPFAGAINELTPYTVTWLDGRDTANITLEKGQILMDEQLFKALGLSYGNSTLELNLYGNTDEFKGTFTVVGTVESMQPLKVETYTEPLTGKQVAEIAAGESSAYNSVLVFSLDDFNPETYNAAIWPRTVIFHSDEPLSVKQMIKSIEPDLSVTTVYEAQEEALKVIRTEKATKALIAMLLLLILGINLYSSFANSLNERKFEIGVKRALGASAFTIVRQFFYESMLVMITNLAITVSLVVDMGLVLKIYREATYRLEDIGTNTVRANYGYQNYVLYITSQSVAMFAVCALVLTVVFSLIFAYKATRVQIVDYLKAE